jgi:hypothetical protein
MKLLRRVMNVASHSAFVISSKVDSSKLFRHKLHLVKVIVLTNKPQIAISGDAVRP